MTTAWTIRIQSKLYQCLEHPKYVWQVLFHLLIFCYVLLTLCLSAVMNMSKEHEQKLGRIVFGMEAGLAVYFTCEFMARLWAAGANHQFKGRLGRLRYLTRFISVVDTLIVAASLLLLVFGSKGGAFLHGPAVQNLRFLQILRMLHVDRRATTWRIMEKVLKLHKTELLTALYLSMLGLLTMSYLVYLSEGFYTDQGNQGAFNNYGDALWWGTVTLLTIGYGDIVPKYWVSKLLTGLFSVTCVSLFTLTSSIIGVGLALMVQGKSRQKQLKRQIPFAKQVLQTFWREKLMNERFECIPLYRYTLTQQLIAHELASKSEKESASGQQQTTPQATARLPLIGLIESIKIRVASSSSLINTLNLSVTKPHRKVGGLDEQQLPAQLRRIREFPKEINNPIVAPKFDHVRRRSFSNGDLADCIEHKKSFVITDENFFRPPTAPENPNVGEQPRIRFEVSAVESAGVDVAITVDEPATEQRQTAEKQQHKQNANIQIPARYVIALNAIWRMKFLVAKRKFRRVRKPYDLQDITEQLTESESLQLNQVRKVLMRFERVAGLPCQSSLSADEDLMTLMQRLELLESKMTEITDKVLLMDQTIDQLAGRVLSLIKRN